MFTHSAGSGHRPKMRITRPLPLACKPSCVAVASGLCPAGKRRSPSCAQAANAPSTASLTTACAELHHLSTTHWACCFGPAALVASLTRGSAASSWKASGPQRSQKAAASVRATSSHVGSEAQRLTLVVSLLQSPRALVTSPRASLSRKRPKVSWTCWSRLSCTFRTRSALYHCVRRHTLATRKNCCESQVTSKVAARERATGSAEPSKNWNSSSLPLQAGG
mmetsp:Transcript_149320/g.416192  ORF Transcript_149320/g.416192 Transcript_149320/m.416192 type:complete len:222 (+) Transcript_149320:350-1015(+)